MQMGRTAASLAQLSATQVKIVPVAQRISGIAGQAEPSVPPSQLRAPLVGSQLQASGSSSPSQRCDEDGQFAGGSSVSPGGHCQTPF